MEKETIEYNELIAIRVPPSDRWKLVEDKTETIHKSLTDALEAWFEANQEKAANFVAKLYSTAGIKDK